MKSPSRNIPWPARPVPTSPLSPPKKAFPKNHFQEGAIKPPRVLLLPDDLFAAGGSAAVSKTSAFDKSLCGKDLAKRKLKFA